MIVGFTAGAFDLPHAGHVAFLEACNRQCDYLIVGLQTNPHNDREWKHIPIQSTYERWKQLECYSNKIIPYDKEIDLENLLAIEGINVRFVGSDYEGKDFTGKNMCDRREIKIVYIPRLHTYSTSELRNRI